MHLVIVAGLSESGVPELDIHHDPWTSSMQPSSPGSPLRRAVYLGVSRKAGLSIRMVLCVVRVETPDSESPATLAEWVSQSRNHRAFYKKVGPRPIALLVLRCRTSLCEAG